MPVPAESGVQRGQCGGIDASGWRAILHVATSIALLAAAAFFLLPDDRATDSARHPLPATKQPVGDAPMRGEPGAPAGLIVYCNFESPPCRFFAREVLPLLEDRYIGVGKAFLAFRHHVPPQMQSPAMIAARIADCANDLGRFWSVHDQLFFLDVKLSEEAVLHAAHRAGVEATGLARCLERNTGAKVVQDVLAGTSIGVTGTPHILVGRSTETGLQVSHVFRGLPATRLLTAALDATLAVR